MEFLNEIYSKGQNDWIIRYFLVPNNIYSDGCFLGLEGYYFGQGNDELVTERVTCFFF